MSISTLQAFKTVEGYSPIAGYELLQSSKAIPSLYEKEKKIFEKDHPNFRAGLSTSDYKYDWQKYTMNGFNVVDTWTKDEAHSGWKRYGNLFGIYNRFNKAYQEIKAEGPISQAEFKEFKREFDTALWSGGKNHDENSVPWHLSNYPLTQLNNDVHTLRGKIKDLSVDDGFSPPDTRYKIGHIPKEVGKGLDDAATGVGSVIGKTISSALEGIFKEPIILFGGIIVLVIVLERV